MKGESILKDLWFSVNFLKSKFYILSVTPKFIKKKMKEFCTLEIYASIVPQVK